MACFAGPSFQEPSGVFGVVWAWASEDNRVVEKAGNKTRLETSARRSIPDDSLSDFIALLLKVAVATGVNLPRGSGRKRQGLELLPCRAKAAKLIDRRARR